MDNPTRIHVFVSCPSDLAPEKAIVAQVCDRINKTLLHSGCAFEFIVREWTEVFGQIGIHPQESINTAITDYDIYIGILWMRFGTPTSHIDIRTGEPFQSGTEEEYVNAYERWNKDNGSVRINFFFKKPIGIYTIPEIDQYKKVLEFKQSILPLGKINEFNDVNDFKDLVYDLLSQIGFKACLAKKTEIKRETLEIELKSTPTKLVRDLSISLKASFLRSTKEIQYYIPRSLKPISEENEALVSISKAKRYINLEDVVIQSNRIVILGNAGTGKSIELQHLFLKYSELESSFFPIYSRFNTYVDEEIEDILPKEWQEINHEILLLLFDGLDEVQPHNFNTAVRKLLQFSEKYPKIKLVISCRTNFYELPASFSTGTLPGFDCYYLNDLPFDEIIKYVTQNFKINGEEFLQKANQAEYLDMLANPFFLNILISHFKKYNNFESKRPEIINDFISSRISLDIKHFELTLDDKPNINEVINLLRRVALSMEMLGRNFITTEELHKIVGSERNIKLLKYFSVFNKMYEAEGLWHFEHNNIQEYLAASCLVNTPVKQVKKLISFAPLYQKIKPSWVNAFSYLISIANKTDVIEYTDWLIQAEPEIIIKFEKDVINKDLRVTLFKQIFETYKAKGIWLKSNKFSDKEFAKFSQSEESIEYLIEEISNSSNSRVAKLNAINVINYIDFEMFDKEYIEKMKRGLMALLEEEENDHSTVYAILSTMSVLKINDKNTLDTIVEMFGKKANQYIRAGLYKLIGDSKYVNDFVEIFLDGIPIIYDLEFKSGREETKLLDETWLLQNGLAKVTSPDAIKTIFSYFSDPKKQGYINIFDIKDVLNALVNNASKAYSIDPSIYSSVRDLFIISGKMFDVDYANLFSKFFVKSDMKYDVLKFIWEDPNMQAIEKGVLVDTLVDRNVIDYFLNDYIKNRYTTSDILEMHKYLILDFAKVSNDKEIIKYYENNVDEKTDVNLIKQEKIDYEAINSARIQKHYDLLFDNKDLMREIERVFVETGQQSIKYETLSELRNKNIYLIDDNYPPIVFSILRDFTRNGSSVSFDKLQKWIESGADYEDYIVGEIYKKVKINRNITTSLPQMKFISDWSLKAADNLDWKSIVIRKDEDVERFTIKRHAQILWFFLKQFNLELKEEHLLGFTLFYDMENFNLTSSHDVIDHLETLIGKDLVSKRVEINIYSGIDVSAIWKMNSMYAIENSLTSTFPVIINNLYDERKSEIDRKEVLTNYFVKTNDFVSMHEMWEKLQNEAIKWKIIELLLPAENQTKFIVNELSNMLSSEDNSQSVKLKASKYLIELNNIDGLKYYTNFLIEKNNSNFDFHQMSFLSKLSTKKAIPYLLKLLELAKTPEYTSDKFNDLETIVLNALYNIGIYSEDNLYKVMAELEKFILSKMGTVPNINFLYFTIKRMEEQYFMTKSKSYSVEEVITQLEISDI